MRDVADRAGRQRRALRDRRERFERGVACAPFDRGGFVMFPIAASRPGPDGREVNLTCAIRAEERFVIDLEAVR